VLALEVFILGMTNDNVKKTVIGSVCSDAKSESSTVSISFKVEIIKLFDFIDHIVRT